MESTHKRTPTYMRVKIPTQVSRVQKKLGMDGTHDYLEVPGVAREPAGIEVRLHGSDPISAAHATRRESASDRGKSSKHGRDVHSSDEDAYEERADGNVEVHVVPVACHDEQSNEVG